MFDDRSLIEQHIQRTLVQRLQPNQYRPTTEQLVVSLWETPDQNPVVFDEAITKPYTKIALGTPWGKPWRTGWFKVETESGVVPKSADWLGHRVEICFDPGYPPDYTGFGAEGLVYSAEGKRIKGLNRATPWIPVTKAAVGGEGVLYYIEVAANPMIRPPKSPFGDFPVDDNVDKPLYQLRQAQLCVLDDQVWDLVRQVEVLQQLMLELGLDSPRRWEILRALERCVDALDPQDVSGTAEDAKKELAEVLSRPAHASAHRVSAIGHAHLDSAWMWPFQETHRKIARTVANAVSLMDEYPEYQFVMSQAQQLEWLKEDCPELFDRVKKKVADGQFIPIGGMWVESDTNLPGGESLVRQFTYGKRFYIQEFGPDPRVVWLPDSFGYSGALPQLIALSGSRWLFTQKMSWNDTNVFPHHTFLWEGIDGTRIFTHATPANKYNAEITGNEMARVVRLFAEKGKATRSLLAYGYSDGGGGPTREHLGRAGYLANLEGSARVSLDSPDEFFEAAEAEYPEPPVWHGEQYLERHRGTYTGQALIKQGNRTCEQRLHQAELWAATAAVRTDYTYPYDVLEQIWKTVLLNQFHDVLPGSAIPWVHREAVNAFTNAEKELNNIIDVAQRALVGEGSKTITFNASPYPLFGVPALGASAEGSADEQVDVAQDGDDWVMENAALRVVVDEHGLLSSLYDREAERELVPVGEVGNLLQLHQDTPVQWDGWDIDRFYRNTVTNLVEATHVGKSVDGKAVVVERSFGNGSSVVQELSLDATEPRLSVATTVTWHEIEKLLKLSFPLDVQAERSASEIQFGHLFRPVHANTSWDAARFEICAHRWLHVGEPDYGVALSNRGTYGHDVTRRPRPGGGTSTTVRASLLRSSLWPDDTCDQGERKFFHSLLVGAGIPEAVREGYRQNTSVIQVPGAKDVEPLVSVDGDVVIETVKLADDREGDVVVRLYEPHGDHARCRLKASFPLTAAWITDLLERIPSEGAEGLDYDKDNAVGLEFHPFQVITVRLRRS